jgi:lipoprotein signal peptidase
MKIYLKGLLLGSLLGVICIVGASLRSNDSLSTLYLFSFWFNRVMMGFTFSLLPTIKTTIYKVVVGLILGLLISFMFYSATDFKDLMGFLAGGAYGLILIFSLQYKKKVH